MGQLVFGLASFLSPFGFKLLMEQGANFTDCRHRHAVTKTASGHATAFLRAPRVLLDLAGAGPIHHQAREAAAMLADPAVSKDVTSFNQQGSRVNFGDLQMLPLADGVMSMLLQLQGVEASPQMLSLVEAGFAGVFCAGMLWAVAWIFEKVRHKEGMGMGDIKMMLLIGSFLGLESSLFTFFVASLVGSVAGVLFIWLAKKEAATYELPFGSFLGAVAIAVAFWMR